MPIYAYRCATCGHAQDVLQKLSDPLLSTCPACGAEAFQKQLTAAGFQLKGSGWYATDFRNGNQAPAKPAEAAPAAAAAAGDTAQTAAAPAVPASPSTGTGPASGASAAAPAAGGCGSSCGCH